MSGDGAACVIRVGNRLFFEIQPSVVDERLWERLKAGFAGKDDYSDDVKARFDRLLLQLVRFLSDRTDGSNSRLRYLSRIKAGADAPLEVQLQEDLYDYLVASGDYPELEKTDVSSGRVDIYIRLPRFRFVLEVKRLLSKWSEDAIAPFLRQTRAYQQTDIRLGVLAVLDLSDRPAGEPHLDLCASIHVSTCANGLQRSVALIRVPGNRVAPSSA